MRGLKGKSAIVTGGASGIGRSIAIRLAEEECNVAIIDRNSADAQTLVLSLSAQHAGEFVAEEADISNRESVSKAVDKILKRTGSIWLLVNNAGWNLPARPFLATDEDDWRRIVDVNLMGLFVMHKVVCPHMVAAGGGRIVNISSDAARVGARDTSVYSACKGGIISFTKSLARELARDNILVNCVCPGPTDTPLMQRNRTTSPEAEKWYNSIIRGFPLKRLGTPQDYPGLVAFLASDDGSFMTGQTISISGGMTMC